MQNQQNQTGGGNAASEIKCPINGGDLGDKSPEVVAWWFQNHPDLAAKRYEGRKVAVPDLGAACQEFDPENAQVGRYMGRRIDVVDPSSTNGEILDNYIQSKVIAHLTEHGTTRLNDLAEKIETPKDAIKALDGQGFHIAAAGWVKLGQKEVEA